MHYRHSRAARILVTCAYAATGLVAGPAGAFAQARRAAAPALTAASAVLAPPAIRPLSYTRFVLPNGLVALLNVDHSSPLAVVDVWYHVGSKNDRLGHAGMAHMCEHLMAEGTSGNPVFYRSIGGSSTHWANTTEDITHYYVSVPSNELETVLWSEGHRLATPLAGADSARLDAVRGVIAQERKQDIEDYPFAVSFELTVAALFPPGHPYHLSALPPMTDLDTATLSDVREFCLPFYVPNNAVVSVSGDFDPSAVRRWIEQYFGNIPRGAPVIQPTVPPVTLAAEKRLVLEDSRAAQPVLHLDWPTVGFAHPDRLALNALGSVLSLNHFGLLSKALVYDRPLATTVLAQNVDDEKTGIFEIAVYPRPGASMTEIETVIDSVLAALPSTPITKQQIAWFNNFNADSAVKFLQTRFERADTLAHGEIFAGNPVAYAAQVNRARALTPADVKRAARRYLTPGRVVMSLIPAGKLSLISKPELPYTNVTPASSLRGRR